MTKRKNVKKRPIKKVSTICLCMIVKNESKIIQRCLTSVLKAVNLKYISICDTGSNDNTKELIEEFGKTHNIPTKVHFEIFKNFGYNRSLSAKLAKETFPQADYLLFIDADMELSCHSKFNKALTFTKYTIFVDNGHIRYHRLSLAKNTCNWTCVGVTHEYWDCHDLTSTEGLLEEIWISDKGDGGAKADKFERDIRLLTQGLIDEPKNGRYMFYLAQSYFDIQQYEKALEWYQNRVDFGGWEEERWYAQYKISRCYIALKDTPQVITHSLLAFGQRPTRIEPLFHCIKYLRETDVKYCSLAYQLYKICPKTIPNDILFIETQAYDKEIRFELSVVGYYGHSQGKIDGIKACKEILADKNSNDNLKKLTQNNLNCYNNLKY